MSEEQVVEEKPVKEKKAKKEKAPKVDKGPNKRTIVREAIANVDTFTIADIVELIGGTNSNASTTITLLCREDKAGKLGPIPFSYDKERKCYVRTA